ncbi:type II toxin-antitoxin system RelE/ParE family toxin [Flavobacterium sp.]|uniref:type II toxin-antitoxin system RelE family toxin n=1 Tax=Flavobacterium sp. TaxID=239 RepID=UPI003752925F
MEIVFMNSYLKAIKKIKNSNLILNLQNTIDNVEKADSTDKILNLKKLAGFTNCYRIKVENYRIGLIINNNVATLVQFQHRKDIYNKFP